MIMERKCWRHTITLSIFCWELGLGTSCYHSLLASIHICIVTCLPLQLGEEPSRSVAIHVLSQTLALPAVFRFLARENSTLMQQIHINRWEISNYQLMHCKDLRPTKFINFSHAGAIIFQGCHNCPSNINNIYRLDSAWKVLQAKYPMRV